LNFELSPTRGGKKKKGETSAVVKTVKTSGDPKQKKIRREG